MKKAVYFLAMAALAWLTVQVSAIEAGATIKLTDYWFSKGVGDSWTYQYTQPLGLADFTVTITRITSGIYLDKLRWGDIVKPDGKKTYNIISYDTDNFYLYANEDAEFNPPIPLPLNYKLETVVDNPGNPTTGAWFFRKLDKWTVPAGTYKDILLKIDLDKRFGPNQANTLFNLPASIPYGVTHAGWSARGVGILMDKDFDEYGQAGNSYTLKSTNATPGGKSLPSVVMLLLMH